jgi:hypothetical protein
MYFLKKEFMNINKIICFFCIAITLIALQGCETDDPIKEDVPELITKVTLTFTPAGGGEPVVGTAIDPDGDGVQDIQVDGSIHLTSATDYSLDITLINELAEPSDPQYNITEEVEEEADEHIFFFSWAEGLFSDPTGDGNVDNRADVVNYEDADNNGFPLGLNTFWTTGNATTGEFRVILKHQPDIKSATSDASAGETDVDITFEIQIQ